jgi:serine/threonine-protein kinase
MISVVYKAFDPMIKRFVALKTLHLGFTEPPDDDIAQRFHREAQAAGNLNHQNIGGIYEYGEDAGRAFIAMQYVEGQTLVDLLKGKHRFSLADMQLILSSVLAALDYSHRMGVIHRDVKPGNIMRDNTGTVKTVDSPAVKKPVPAPPKASPPIEMAAIQPRQYSNAPEVPGITH